jgi:hypothetical protein
VTANERRLGDRIHHALDLAIEQENIEVADLLARALEVALTRYGGKGITENRDLPEEMIRSFTRVDELRKQHLKA